jgi:hypothetical protein
MVTDLMSSEEEAVKVNGRTPKIRICGNRVEFTEKLEF